MGKELTFKQKRFLKSRSYKVSEKEIQIRENNLISNSKYSIPLQNVSNERFEITVYSKPLFWTTVLLSFLSLLMLLLRLFGDDDIGDNAELFYGALAIMFGLFLLNSRETYHGIMTTKRPLLFYKDRPSKETLEDFISSVFKKREEYFNSDQGFEQKNPIGF